jgi:hypothetical protein
VRRSEQVRSPDQDHPEQFNPDRGLHITIPACGLPTGHELLPRQSRRASAPPQFVNVGVRADVDDVLRALRLEGVAGRPAVIGGVRGWGTNDCTEVVVVPAAGVPPQLVHMAVRSDVDDMLGALGIEDG